MPIAGEWREGRAGKTRTDENPYTGEVLVELAGPDDLDQAYRAAAEAQRARISHRLAGALGRRRTSPGRIGGFGGRW